MAPGKDNSVSGHYFKNFGSHSDCYPTAYLTAAAAIGMTKEDVDLFISRLDKVMGKVKHGEYLNSDSYTGKTEVGAENKSSELNLPDNGTSKLTSESPVANESSSKICDTVDTCDSDHSKEKDIQSS